MRKRKLSISFVITFALFSLCGCALDGPPKANSASIGSGGSPDADATVSGAAVTQLALGFEHSCARTATGELYCWGHDGMVGALGSGSMIKSSAIPLQVSDTASSGHLTGVTNVAAGYDHESPAVEVTAGYEHTCARLANDSVVCWGGNTWSQLGEVGGDVACTGRRMGVCSYASITVTVGSDKPLKADRVASGSGHHTCAIARTGSVWCWGQNTFGQLGDGKIMSASTKRSGASRIAHRRLPTRSRSRSRSRSFPDSGNGNGSGNGQRSGSGIRARNELRARLVPALRSWCSGFRMSGNFGGRAVVPRGGRAPNGSVLLRREEFRRRNSPRRRAPPALGA